MSGKITISNTTKDVAVIDIEGIIGVPEEQQFDDADTCVATYRAFRDVIAKIEAIGQREIVVNIRSTGGNVNDALLMHDTLKALGAKITTRCFGYVASAATIVAQAASQGCREISANSLYLIHKSVCSAEGNAQAIAQAIDILAKTDERITGIYADRSGKQPSEFAELMGENNGNGRWLSPEEAIGYGLADRIIQASPIAAQAKNAVRNLGLPPIPKHRKNVTEEIAKAWNQILHSVGITQDTTEDTDKKTTNAPASETVARKVKMSQKDERQEQAAVEKARKAAMPTMTKPKEDPSMQEMRLSPNESAYMEDLQRFTGQ